MAESQNSSPAGGAAAGVPGGDQPGSPSPAVQLRVLTVQQAVKLAYAAGFRSGQGLAYIVAIAMAESGLFPLARGNNADGSVDRGILQINNKWHPEVTDACAYDPACAFVAAFKISGQGHEFHPWSTFQAGAHKRHLTEVHQTIRNMGAPYAPINAPVQGLPQSWQLTPWTPIDQMGTWAPTAAYAADRSLECFQACLVSVYRWSSGVWVSAAYEDQLVHDPSVPQATTWQQALTLLADNETHGVLHYPATQHDYQQLAIATIAAGHPLIPLRYWRTVGNAVLHFVVITGYTQESVQIMNPDGGLMQTESWADHYSFYTGQGVLAILRKRALGDH